MPSWPLKILISTLVALAAIFVLVLVQESPQWVFHAFGQKSKFPILQFIGVSMGGVLIAIQATLSYSRAKAMEDTAKAHLEANSNFERGQQQERFKNAIEHLGHKMESVRLGGAYELFHIAQEFKHLRKAAFDILCAHIRSTTKKDEYRKKYSERPSEEIQSLLTLLFVNDHNIFEGERIDLSNCWLNGSILTRARLARADFWKAHLKGAGLNEADLQCTVLYGADLRHSALWKSNLNESNLERSVLKGSDLNNSSLKGAVLIGANMQGVVLKFADMSGSHLACADLRGSDISNAKLLGADLTCANLQGSLISNASMVEAEMLFCDVRGAQRRKATGTEVHHSFSKCILDYGGRHTDISNVVFGGGISREYIDEVAGLTIERLGDLWQAKMTKHIGKAKVHEVPEECELKIGSYTKEDAEKWIADYEEKSAADLQNC